MLMVELKGAPRFVHKYIVSIKSQHRDTIIDVFRSRATNDTRVLIHESPKGWWLALRIMMKGSSQLYRLVEVKELDLPSVLLKASLENSWNPKLEREISQALREGGWIE